jgi:hypothetical protein
MGLASMTTEQWLLSAAAVATAAFLAVAIFQPGVFDPEPDWEVSDGCLGGLEHQDLAISFHYHPKLKVIVDGQQITIEPNTGPPSLSQISKKAPSGTFILSGVSMCNVVKPVSEPS